MINIKREEVLELLFEPTMEIVDRLETVRDSLTLEEKVLLDQLKFRLGIFAYSRNKKAKEDADGFFQKSNKSFGN